MTSSILQNSRLGFKSAGRVELGFKGGLFVDLRWVVINLAHVLNYCSCGKRIR
jgi:hypothetical protein